MHLGIALARSAPYLGIAEDLRQVITYECAPYLISASLASLPSSIPYGQLMYLDVHWIRRTWTLMSCTFAHRTGRSNASPTQRGELIFSADLLGKVGFTGIAVAKCRVRIRKLRQHSFITDSQGFG
jgi:hypothetical protein